MIDARKGEAHRTRIYGFLGVAVAVGPLVLAVLFGQLAMHYTGFFVGGALVVGALAARAHARTTWLETRQAANDERTTSGVQRLTPVLTYQDVPAAHDFLVSAFGFDAGGITRNDEGPPAHGELRAGGPPIWLHRAAREHRLDAPLASGDASSGLFIHGDDVDAHYERARAAGAAIDAPPADQPSGRREYAARDPEGRRWWFATSVIPIAVVCLAAGSESAGQSSAGAAQDRLFVASLGLGGGIEARYQEEEARLLKICQVYGSACFARHFPEVRWRVATLRSTPAATGRVVGHVVAVLKVSGEQSGGLIVGLDIETTSGVRRHATWMETVGDWGYGIHVPGVQPQGEWIRISHLPIVEAAWLSTTEPDLPALVQPLTDMIVELHPLVATFPGDDRRVIAGGSYLITGVRGGRLEFRAEVATDFACGDPVTAPRVMPPVLRADAAEFFDADGVPRFSPKYQRGC